MAKVLTKELFEQTMRDIATREPVLIPYPDFLAVGSSMRLDNWAAMMFHIMKRKRKATPDKHARP